MSGHSKWSTIKRQKGAMDAKRGATFTKLSNAIAIASRLGGSGDIEANPRLRLAIEAARQANMPKENIQRAIDRGLGKLPGQTIEEVLYEGFGPNKVAILIEGVTDNKMRTLNELRNLFDRNGGTLGSSGSVSYLFDKIGEIKITGKGQDKDDETLELIDLGAQEVEDFEEEGQNKFLVYTEVAELNTMGKNITQSGFKAESQEVVFKPNMSVEIKERGSAQKVIDFIQKLEELDDVQKVYTNLNIPDGLL